MDLFLWRHLGVLQLSLVTAVADGLLVYLLLTNSFPALLAAFFFMSYLPYFLRYAKNRKASSPNSSLSLLTALFIASFLLAYLPAFHVTTGHTTAKDCGRSIAVGILLIILKALRLAVATGKEDLKASELITQYSSRDSLELVLLLNTNLLQFFLVFLATLVSWDWRVVFGDLRIGNWLCILLSAGMASLRVATHFALSEEPAKDSFRGILTRVSLTTASWLIFQLLTWSADVDVRSLVGLALMFGLTLEMRRVVPSDPELLFDLNVSTTRVDRLTRKSSWSDHWLHK